MAYPADDTQAFPPHNDHEGTSKRCPTCGYPYPDARIRAPFLPRTSGLLDLVLIAKDALSEVQAALEEEVLG